jgi:hypothetical protein
MIGYNNEKRVTGDIGRIKINENLLALLYQVTYRNRMNHSRITVVSNHFIYIHAVLAYYINV